MGWKRDIRENLEPLDAVKLAIRHTKMADTWESVFEIDKIEPDHKVDKLTPWFRKKSTHFMDFINQFIETLENAFNDQWLPMPDMNSRHWISANLRQLDIFEKLDTVSDLMDVVLQFRGEKQKPVLKYNKYIGSYYISDPYVEPGKPENEISIPDSNELDDDAVLSHLRAYPNKNKTGGLVLRNNILYRRTSLCQDDVKIIDILCPELLLNGRKPKDAEQFEWKKPSGQHPFARKFKQVVEDHRAGKPVQDLTAVPSDFCRNMQKVDDDRKKLIQRELEFKDGEWQLKQSA